MTTGECSTPTAKPPVPKSLRSRLWGSLRKALYFLRYTPLHFVWSWIWDREFDSLLADRGEMRY